MAGVRVLPPLGPTGVLSQTMNTSLICWILSHDFHASVTIVLFSSDTVRLVSSGWTNVT